MAENKIQIIMDLIDKATPEFKKANAELIKMLKELEKQSEKTNQKQKNALEVASAALRKFRSSLLIVTATVGTLAIATNEWAKRNKEIKDSFLEIQIASSKTLSAIGKWVSVIIPFFGELAKKINEAFGKDSIEDLIRANDSLQEFNKTVQENAVLFNSNSISAKEYYDNLLNQSGSVINQNKELMGSLSSLASLQAELSNESLMESKRSIEEQVQLLKFYEENYKDAHAGMVAFTLTVAQTIKTSMTSAFTNIITGVQSAKEAFAQLGKAMVQAIVQFMIQKVVASILENTLLQTAVANSIVAATAIAEAWKPAALYASLGTGGLNAGGAMAGIAATAAALNAAGTFSNSPVGNVLKGMAIGGSFGREGLNFGGAQANGGDYMVNRPTLFLAGEAGPERATFTPIGGRGGGGGFGDINIYIQGGIRQDGDSVERMAEKLGFEFERQTRTSRGF